MGRVHVVVDGSNIATEGRTAPSLAQLDEAVRGFVDQYGYEKVTVIVDATFGHRIEAAERPLFEDAILAGELVTPPAGTIGRGDAFILQVARMADADVLSNDSFQELHAEHPWLFEAGRLWGGKPVPAVGWVFVGRAPVRGVVSRRTTQAAKRASAKDLEATAPAPAAPAKATSGRRASTAKKAAAATTAPRRTARAKAAPDLADDIVTDVDAEVAEVATASNNARRRRRRGGGGSGGGGGDASTREPLNEQLAYASFVIEHPIGSTVAGTVERFSSHGAYVRVAGAAGYVPLRALGDPPPRSAREVLSLGEERTFVVTRFDPATRGIDVVPGDLDAHPTSAPSGAEAAPAPARAVSSEPHAEEALVSPAAKKTATRKKAAVKKTAAKKKATTKKAAAKKTTAKRAPAKKATARKTTAKKATAKKATAKRAPAKKTAAKKKAATKRAPAKKTAAKKKTTARKAPAKKR